MDRQKMETKSWKAAVVSYAGIGGAATTKEKIRRFRISPGLSNWRVKMAFCDRVPRPWDKRMAAGRSCLDARNKLGTGIGLDVLGAGGLGVAEAQLAERRQVGR